MALLIAKIGRVTRIRVLRHRAELILAGMAGKKSINQRMPSRDTTALPAFPPKMKSRQQYLPGNRLDKNAGSGVPSDYCGSAYGTKVSFFNKGWLGYRPVHALVNHIGGSLCVELLVTSVREIPRQLF